MDIGDILGKFSPVYDFFNGGQGGAINDAINFGNSQQSAGANPTDIFSFLQGLG